MEKRLLSFVIPCYRSELTIEKVYNEIVTTVAKRPYYDYEIIAVNDSSPDGVLNILKKLSQNDVKFKVIDLARNFGKHSAMMAGYSVAKGDLIVDIDDDYQCPVYALWDLVDAVVEEGYDCATAKYEKKQEKLWKRLGSKFNAVMINLMLEPPKGLVMENFTVSRRFVIQEILRYNNPYPYIMGLMMRTTHRIKQVLLNERDRADNKTTGFTVKKSISLFINGLTAFSVKPLRMATVIGITFALFGFIYGAVVIIRKLVHPEILIGYSSAMAIHLFSSGIIMLILGLIGEYLGRIYISINNSPQYVIRETINIENSISVQ